VPAVPGAITFAGPQDTARVAEALDQVATGERPRLAFALPSASGWALPVYELAIMAAVELRDRGVIDPQLTVVTAEPSPLWAFGPEAAAAVERLLAERRSGRPRACDDAPAEGVRGRVGEGQAGQGGWHRILYTICAHSEPVKCHSVVTSEAPAS